MNLEMAKEHRLKLMDERKFIESPKDKKSDDEIEDEPENKFERPFSLCEH
jgi:hypothetical protein